MIHYCHHCVLPDSRPGIALDEAGVCTACRGHEDKERHIDWDARGRALQRVVAEAMNHDGPVVVEVRSSLERISAYVSMADLKG